MSSSTSPTTLPSDINSELRPSPLYFKVINKKSTPSTSTMYRSTYYHHGQNVGLLSLGNRNFTATENGLYPFANGGTGIQWSSCFTWLWCLFGRNEHPETPVNDEIHDIEVAHEGDVPSQTEISGEHTSQENNMRYSQGNDPLLDKVVALSIYIGTIGTAGSFTLIQLSYKGTGNETLLKAINVLLGASSLTAFVIALVISFTRVFLGKTLIIKLIFGGSVALFLSGFSLVLVFNMHSV